MSYTHFFSGILRISFDFRGSSPAGNGIDPKSRRTSGKGITVDSLNVVWGCFRALLNDQSAKIKRP